MSNQEKLKNYLLGKDDKVGYLKSELSNGKVIMLSGKWGSGKTHFWQNIIASDEFKKELKEKGQVYSYISLYGKSSIEEIENDIFSQAYYSAIGGENFVTKGFSTFTKRMQRFGSKKVAIGLKEEQRDNIERTALKRLENGGIICFDDFERKSKDIDLNDLFGFITQLTINFKCKVMIILNDDVFEGDEKDIFSNVKEKTVSKYLKYEPSIKELLNLIIDDKKKYKVLDDYYKVILDTFLEANILNARIYMQVLDNLLEWVENDNTEKDEKVIEYLLFANIFFILYHDLPTFDDNQFYITPKKYYIFTKNDEVSKIINKLIAKKPIFYEEDNVSNIIKTLMVPKPVENFLNELKMSIKNSSVLNPCEYYLELLDNNQKTFESIYFLNKGNRPNLYKNTNEYLSLKVEKFLETGILED